MQKQVENTIKTFFEKLGAKIESLEVSENETNIFSVAIKSEDSGLLIGPHGKNLEAIQGVLKIMLSKQVKDRIRLHIEINDYLQSKDDKLLSFIKSKIISVEKGASDIILPFYGAYDRKKIHSFVAEYGNPAIYTKSTGEGRERRLCICKKPGSETELSQSDENTNNSKLSIDINGDDI